MSAPDAPDPVPVVVRGLVVFPLPPGARRPAGPGWWRDCLTTAAAVHTRWPAGANIGVACRPSDLVGVDLDWHGDVDGPAVFAALCATHGQDWPDTLTVATPHGTHLYFWAGGRPITSTSGDRSPLGPGIDVRGPGRRAGGYLIGPGSLVDGVRYRITRDTTIADLPAWLADLLTDLPDVTRTPAPTR